MKWPAVPTDNYGKWALVQSCRLNRPFWFTHPVCSRLWNSAVQTASLNQREEIVSADTALAPAYCLQTQSGLPASLDTICR